MKKTYSSPSLQTWGTVADLTMSGNTIRTNEDMWGGSIGSNAGGKGKGQGPKKWTGTG
jgi:hypothetical protein